MTRGTKIQWTDDTVNPTMGCEGCELWKGNARICYAGILHERLAKTSSGYSPNFNLLTLYPGRMDDAAKAAPLTGLNRSGEPWKSGMPRMIFISDMSDSFSVMKGEKEDYLFEYLFDEVIATVTSEAGQRHIWQWLTKQPQRMAEFSKTIEKKGIDWPPNLWAGTSITSKKTLDRILPLTQVGDERTIHFLSVEPQFAYIDFNGQLDGIQWLIQAGASGHNAKAFDQDWIAPTVEACRKSNVAYFLKQLGENPTKGGVSYKLQNRHGGDWNEWPKELRIREFPALKSVHEPPSLNILQPT